MSGLPLLAPVITESGTSFQGFQIEHLCPVLFALTKFLSTPLVVSSVVDDVLNDEGYGGHYRTCNRDRERLPPVHEDMKA